MPVLSFNYATLKDTGAFQDYVTKAASLMKAANVEVIVRAKYADTLLGKTKAEHVSAVFRYADMEAAKGFYSSEEYLKIVPLRDRACEMSIHFYDE
ncbi:DUF1330 domain-containing protein [Sulfitobacter pacificus]|uniref:DUF1330 domain-containing protein n=1 Tax=Sulfitobacter pacificus TaxID=1499314 RepID=A0ABQ5VKC0_9RHOB|nr:DUF1330 domain-containing protein [Sulfitobacter pacificus]GLQ27580.1 hypothetical protein GCM10007927_23830 [Sulfitobacter pacificus]